MSEFYNQGAVPLSSEAYIPRVFEDQVFQEIIAGRWVLLLGPRQHGKSTGLVRLNSKFRGAGLVGTLVDLQGLPPCASFRELLRWFADQIGKNLAREIPRPHDESQGDVVAWLDAAFAQGGPPVVIIIDEAGSIENTEFRNSFYGQIRQLSSMRADAPEGAIAKRIRFVFSGTFRPETLVHERNSPFNVCQTIQTDDVSIEQMKTLAATVHPELKQFVEKAHAILNGQPFLLQTLFQETLRRSEIAPELSFAEALANLPYLFSGHLEGIFSKVIGNPSLAQKVAVMAQQGYIDLIPADSDCSFLQILGLAKREDARLIFRNSLYASVAKASPQIVTTPDPQPIRAAVYGIQKTDLGIIKNPELREICFSAYDGAAKAHGTGSYRLALTGFGSATEAMLLDLLVGLKAADLQAAIMVAKPNFNKFEDQADPYTWRFVNLINVAKQVRVGTKAPEPSHALREWRNLVHPAAAMKHFVDESKLQPESLAASALFAILLRDIT